MLSLAELPVPGSLALAFIGWVSWPFGVERAASLGGYRVGWPLSMDDTIALVASFAYVCEPLIIRYRVLFWRITDSGSV